MPDSRRSAGAVLANLIAGYVVLSLSIASCTLLLRHRLATEHGTSFFGTQPHTVVAYALGLVVAAALFLGAARALPETAPCQTRLLLEATGVLLIALVVTPYTAGTLMNWTHAAFGAVLFAGQLLYSGWIAHTEPGRRTIGLFAAQFAAGLVCFAADLDLTPAMLQGEIAFQALFAVQLYQAVRRDLATADAAVRISRSRASPA